MKDSESIHCNSGYRNVDEKYSLNPRFQMVDMDGVMCSSCHKKGDDAYYNECTVCDNGGNLLRCDTCPSVYHLECISPPLEHAPAGIWSCPDCNKKDELLPLKEFKRSIKRKKLSLKAKKHSTMKKVDYRETIISSRFPVIEQEKVTEEQSVLHMKVNDPVWNATSIDDRYRLEKIERPKICTSREAWSEEELDTLWIAVRRHKAGNWDAMLMDPTLKCLQHRTSESLSERWKLERQNILDMEKPQAPLIAAVKPLEPISEEMVPAGDYYESKRPKGFLKICKPQKSFGKSLIPTKTNSFPSKSQQNDPPLGKKSQLGKRLRKKRPNGGCKTEKGRERRDESATESELSLKEWLKGDGASSEETISD